MQKSKQTMNTPDEVIFSYTADQAVKDGYLTPTTDLVPDEDMAKQAGFTIPVRLTPGVHELVEVPKHMNHQDLKGRLWDLLFMAALAVKRSSDDTLAEFEVIFQMPEATRTYKLWACLDMTSGPAIHIMRPEEY